LKSFDGEKQYPIEDTKENWGQLGAAGKRIVVMGRGKSEKEIPKRYNKTDRKKRQGKGLGEESSLRKIYLGRCSDWRMA